MPRSKKPKKCSIPLVETSNPNVTSSSLESEKQPSPIIPRLKPLFSKSTFVNLKMKPLFQNQLSTFKPEKTQNLMTKRAIASAKKHEINVCQGKPIPADGNCAIESVIANINERECFSDSFNFSADVYRRIWATEFKNRAIDDKTWNIYTNQEWEQGWVDMMNSGVYERGLFGDLMLFAVACGVGKTLLIINTSLDSPHDPIYICDPKKFDVNPSTDIPVVLAYDMSHYESLHPLTDLDIEKTIQLVQQYQAGNYAFSKADLPFLLDTEIEIEQDERLLERIDNGDGEERPIGAKIFEDSLPENLRGKRPKEMNLEEKKIYNNLRRKFSRLNESPDSAANRRRKSNEAKASRKSRETSSETAERNAVKANQMKAKRATETSCERAERNAVNAIQKKEKRAKETSYERAERNAVNAIQMKEKRATETSCERAERNAVKANQMKAKRKNETKEEAAKRKQKIAIQREQKIPKSLYDGRNAKKVLLAEQIVPELKYTKDSIGEMNSVCKFCDARKWKDESPTLCCNSGKVILPLFPDPPDLLKELLTSKSEEGRLFRKNTRTFNNALALSSLKVNVKKFTGGFAPSVIFEGKVCQRIGPMLPEDGEEPKFAQLYVHDPATEHTSRIKNMSLPDSMSKHEVEIITNTLLELQQMLKDVNPFVKDLLHICEIPEDELSKGKLVISCKERPTGSHERKYNVQQNLSEVSVFTNSLPGDMVLRKRGGGLQTIYDIHPSAQPLHFVLLFPFGTKGYYEDLKHVDKDTKRVSPREFFAFHINMRCLSSDFLLRYGRLFQEYLCLAFTTIESQRLKYQRDNQKALRADTFKNVRDLLSDRMPLADKITADDHNLKIGKRIVLSSSFPGSPRWYNSKFQDGMAICRKYRKPDLFITFTCNQNWEEIKQELREGETVQDRPDLVARVFKLKKDQLMNDIKLGRVFGKVSAFLWVIEFQKRGLPHAHILIILSDEDRPSTSEDIDNMISAEIPPDPNLFPPNSEARRQAAQLEAIVIKNMVHGPCGKINPSSPCMQDGKCSKGYPKPFCEKTIVRSEKSYPQYQRSDPGHGGRTIVIKVKSEDVVIDNRWIVPYSPFLSLRDNGHINIELCISPTAAKYLFKYITKGEDRAMVRAEIEGQQKVKDEIEEFLDLRSVGSSEAAWHILNFNISQNKPAVYALRVHLKEQQHIVFDMGNEEEVLEKQRSTELTAFFEFNSEHTECKTTYVEFPEMFLYDSREKKWKKRKNVSDTIGRIHSVHPLAGDIYYLRMLLHHEHCKGKTSFEDLMSLEGRMCESYQEVCRTIGLLQDDNEWDEALAEGAVTRMSSSLRELFVMIVLFCHPANSQDLFNKHHMEWADDFISNSLKAGVELSESQIRTLIVIDIQQRLQSWDKDLTLIKIAEPTEAELEQISFSKTNILPVLIREELDFDIEKLRETVMDKQSKFTTSQRSVFERVINAVNNSQHLSLFIDARGGTGKTYVLNAILAAVRLMDGGSVALAVGSTGIAANLLHLGRTFHSRFKVPLNVNSESVCNIDAQSTLAKLIRMAKVIVWDEAPMNHKFQMEALDRTLRDITGQDLPFGGIVTVLSGDFRQCLAVIQHASRAEIVDAALNRSMLWSSFAVMQLKENMRVILSKNPDTQGFDDFTLKLGDGLMEVVEDTDLVEIPADMCMKIKTNTAKHPDAEKKSMSDLADHVYPNFSRNINKVGWMDGRAILAPTNKQVDELNNLIADTFPGKPVVLTSSDQVINPDDHQRFNVEYLNSLSPSGLPSHRLFIKSGMPLMLMRNLNPKMGLCNGTRLIFNTIHKNHLLECKIVGGEHRNRLVLIPRITLQPKEREFPFEWNRRQFPVRVAFAMTINKSQGQTLQNVGVWLHDTCFAHGQLYVALSRVGSPSDIKFAIRQIDNLAGAFTSNVVYKEVLIKGKNFIFKTPIFTVSLLV